MHWFRKSRLFAALITLFSLLFMQLAVASYACPNLQPRPASAAEPMPGCAGMDMEQPSLCHAHDQVGNQSLDKPNVPQVQPFVAVGLTQALRFIEPSFHSLPTQPRSLVLKRTTAPPLAIRNCCFRI
jgi:hypothetical protein